MADHFPPNISAPASPPVVPTPMTPPNVPIEPSSVPAQPAQHPFAAQDPATDLTSVSQGMLGQQPPAQPVVGGPRRRELGSAPLPESSAALPQEAAPAPEVAPVPETLPSPEMGPELEKFVEQVERQKKATEQTVIAAETMPNHVPRTISQPVVVLPLTEKTLKTGQSKSTKFSVRWLSEWCVRQIKKFRSLLVVYRENE